MEDNGVRNRSRQNIQMLEEALRQISSVRNQLKNNSAEVKGEIQMAFSNQLDSLRSREVFLLSQVDVIKSSKDNILQRQEQQLNRALGNLQGVLSTCADENNTHHSNAAQTLEDITARLKNISLQPKVTANIEFEVSSEGLREAIHSYGRVDPLRMPPDPIAFSPVESPSASLPRVFEDYEDPEHHIFYKTLSDMKGLDNIIEVKPPRVCQPVADWLLKTPEAPKCDNVCPTVFPPFITSSVGRSYNSTDQWLLNMKHAVELEDDQCELQSRTSRFSTPSECSDFVVLSVQNPESLFEIFRTKMTNKQEWLKAENSSSMDDCNLMNWFKANHDKSTWLSKDKFQANEYNCYKQKFCQPVSEEEMDIENLYQLPCVNTASSHHGIWLSTHNVSENLNENTPACSPFECHQDYHEWLLGGGGEKDVDELQAKKDLVRTVCRANEMCESFSDCVCDKNCCHMAHSAESSQFCGSQDFCSSNDFGYFQNLSQNVKDWLLMASSAHTFSDESDRFMPHSDNNVAWLAENAKTEANDNNITSFCKDENTRKWLLPLGSGDIDLVSDCLKYLKVSSEVGSCIQENGLDKWLSKEKVISNKSEPDEEDYVWLQKKEGSTEKLAKQKFFC